MKKLFSTTLLAASLLSSAAFSADYVKPMQHKDTSAFDKWQGVISKQPIISSTETPSLAALMGVFSEAGGFQYQEDYKQYDKWYHSPNPQFDYWATPDETAKNKAGDCEDFALFWYYKAREAGFKPEQLAVVVGFLPQQNNQSHAILAAEVDGKEYVLDSYNMTIQPSEYYSEKNFRLTYRINENGWGVK